MYVPCSGMHVKVWKGMCHGNSSHSHSGNSADFRVVIHMSSFLLHTSDFYDGCNYSFHYGNRKNVKWLYSSLLVFVIKGEKKKTTSFAVEGTSSGEWSWGEQIG